MLESTGHARHADLDYAALLSRRMRTARDGVRWHLIETTPGSYDWQSLAPMVDAANRSGMQVIWDLCHYGYPRHVDVFSPDFPDRFARFSAAVALYMRRHIAQTRWYCPINEISYWSWACGDMAHFGPSALDRGAEMKKQLVKASLRAMTAIRHVDPGARFVHADPLIHVTPLFDDEKTDAAAASATQYDAWDMLAGLTCPELGGGPEFIDVVGVNFYPHNQWFHKSDTIRPGASAYRPFRDMLSDVHQRYARPILVAETGAEGLFRCEWFRYVCDEVMAALQAGTDVHGICLYPVTDYPGWFDDRPCETGLLGRLDNHGHRPVYVPLARELAMQQSRFADGFSAMHPPQLAVS